MFAVEPLPPAAYSSTWSVLGWVTLATAALVLAWALFARPARAVVPALATPGEPAAPAGQPVDYLERLALIEQAWRSGALKTREVHHELSHTVRHFLTTSAAIPAMVMTVAELRASGFADGAEVLESFRDHQFAPNAVTATEASVAAARRLITGPVAGQAAGPVAGPVAGPAAESGAESTSRFLPPPTTGVA